MYRGLLTSRQASRLVAAAVAATLLSASALAEQTPSTQTLLTLATGYVRTFVDKFSNMRAEEHYVQDWKTQAGIPLMRREWMAEFLLTQIGDSSNWQVYRDVFEVNGVPVRDRQDRLEKLLFQPMAEVADQAAAISAESARYNIGNLQRTVNQPLFVLIFLQPDQQRRFSYSIDRADRSAGENVWILGYKETARPTLIRGTSNKDLPAQGRIWIDSSNGRIVRTELRLEDKNQSAQITTSFRNEERFGIDVPFQMDEQYSVKGNGGKISAKASYGQFRQFEVATTLRVK